MSSMSYPTQPSVVGEDLASDVLLMKIAELAPVLAREAHEVNALCKMTGQWVNKDVIATAYAEGMHDATGMHG